ncbi:hypothetical protein [Streptomyces erythrochromogenes]|uniref:hypothetical protein n=1 Tax=Streptomyces erythrochromogenes TaxID=285574 RepID=UPI003868A649|nr:hypothetical protein OG364_05350 [Streptomyces erythrochromogenes]
MKTLPHAPGRRAALAAGAALLALTCTATGSSYAATPPEVPTPVAYEGTTPLASTEKVTEYCAAHPGGCRFEINRAASGEYYSAVKSLGNAVVNCTKDAITVAREITLRTSSTDNLGGEITGKISIEGTISTSGEVTAGVDAKAKGEFSTPDKSKGPTATVGAEAGASGSGKIAGSLGVKGAFEGAFKLAYQRSWTTEHIEKTTYNTTVRPGDALVFGASSAMQRIAGEITTGSGLGIRKVVVDGPSTVNSSTFVADTFTVPGNTCDRLRPEGKTGTEDTTDPAPPRGLTPASLPEGSRLKERDVLAPGTP